MGASVVPMQVELLASIAEHTIDQRREDELEVMPEACYDSDQVMIITK